MFPKDLHLIAFPLFCHCEGKFYEISLNGTEPNKREKGLKMILTKV